jgi:hypothetical protein
VHRAVDLLASGGGRTLEGAWVRIAVGIDVGIATTIVRRAELQLVQPERGVAADEQGDEQEWPPPVHS